MAIELKDWTMLIYRFDKRYKEGRVLHKTYDYKMKHEGWMHEEIRDLGPLYPAHKFHIEVRETYVTRKNLMTGEEFQERFDTPWTCSPASESYWSA